VAGRAERRTKFFCVRYNEGAQLQGTQNYLPAPESSGAKAENQAGAGIGYARGAIGYAKIKL